MNLQHEKEKIVTVNDSISINYDTFGNSSDPAILLIQGFACQMILWKEDFCKSLASQGYYVIRFDNRDIGLSSKLDNATVPSVMEVVTALRQGKDAQVPYKLIDMAKDAIGLLDALKIRTAHIIGFSMGGMIAQTMAIEYPNRVKTLTSISSTTGNPALPGATPEAQAILLTPPPTELPLFIDQEVKIWKLLNGPVYKFDEDFIKKRGEILFKRCFYPQGKVRQYCAIIASGSRNESLKKLQIPTLVIHGDADPLIPVEGGKDTAQSIPGSELMIIEGMGHTHPVEVTPRIVEAILKNIKKAN